MSKKNSSLFDLIADIETTAPADYDPEDTHETFQEENEQKFGSDAEDNEDAARDHYITVGKSKLRSEQPTMLDDPRYSGKRASRKDVFSEEEEEESASEDNDDSFDDDEDLMGGVKDDEEEIDDEEIDSDEQALRNEETDSDEAADSDEVVDDDANESDGELNEELRKIQDEEKQIISQLSKSAQSDIEKGQHVRQQLTLWDNCLESRIRMQKIVESANKLPQKDNWIGFLAKAEGVESDLEEVKAGLREVMDDLIDIRTGLFEQNGCIDLSKKNINTRKRHLEDEDEIYNDKLWKDMSEINDVFVPFRNSTLEKWSNKVQVAAGAKLNKKFKAFDQNIMTQIDTVLGDKEGLIKRTQLQRSDYHILGKVKLEVTKIDEEIDTGKKADRHLNTYDVEIFDDQDFYQQQLRELIESRMVDTDDPTAIGMRWAARKNEQKKKKRAVNTKASKGRQLR
ncbi:apoptosis antagonizing transcription factor-domain-containing protein [Sporodiniella umbellata]|nr:apoptosis antagonizing transcription factor-domain-containing protein [Sporodiniella umbellata]